MTPMFKILTGKILTGMATAALLALALPVSAQEFSAPQKTEIEHIIREYLVSHPEVLQEAIAELQKREAAAELERTRAAVSGNADTLFNSSRQVVLGNPHGNVTMVEFFDYNCGYCKRAMADMLNLIKNDPNLRVVLKEFPVLGAGSIEAAKVAVAVRMQDPDGKRYLEFHQRLLGGRGQADKARALAVAREIGLDMARLEADLESEEVKASLDESLKLGEQLGLNGTPSYVVGSDIVIGAVGLDALRGKVSTARCGSAQC
jgi:protein-disulfide isomerase